MKKNLIVAGLTGFSLLLLAAIFVSPIWWVSLTAPNYPPEAFPDGVRIPFHMTGVFNGCRKVEKDELQEVEALDCVHEMDTINHYVGMYPIAAGGPIERAISQFPMPFLGTMLLGFVITSPGLRFAVMGVGFAVILVLMYLTIYADDGLGMESAAYVTALVTSLDQDTAAEAGVPAETGVVAALRRSLEASGIKVDVPDGADSGVLSDKQRLIDQLRVTFEKDQQRSGNNEAWNGSTFQVMSWHYGKSLGRYFNNPAEIEPMVKTVKMATHLVFGGLVAAMLLLLVASRKTGGLFYWLLVLVPMALPVFFIIDFSAWLWLFGHKLNTMGAFTVKPFMPTVFGQGKVAQFATHSYPYTGFGLMLLMSVLLGIAALIRRKQLRDGGA